MARRFISVGLFICFAIGAAVAPAFAAGEPQRLKIIYSSFTGAYAPLWIAVEERLGRKHGLDIEAVYAGRARPHQLLLSGDAQFVVSTGTGVVSSYAVGTKDLVIIASFVNTTGSSIFSKPQIKSAKELQGKNIASGRPGAVSDILLHYILKRRVGLEPGKDVKIIPVGDTPAILPALERGVVDAAMLTTPSRLVAKNLGFRELIDFDQLGVQYPYVGISTLKVNVKKSPDMTLRFVRTMIDGIQVFKNNKEKSMAVMKRYLRGASDEMLDETYNYFASRMPRLPYPSIEAVKTALDMMSDQFPQASSVDPNEVVDLSFVKQAQAGDAGK